VQTQGLPLSRFTVLDFTRVRSGPTATRQLADWGARVIKIELPVEQAQEDNFTGERHSSDFQNLNRNKESITLNLKAREATEIIRRLVLRGDVVTENFRPDVKYRLKLDYETLAAINPRIVYGSISGFGQDGPYAKRPGVDQIAQGMSGIMSVTGKPGEGPMRVGTAIGDVTSGLYLAFGILAALLERETSGRGQKVDTSLVESLIGLMDFQSAAWLVDKRVPQQQGNDHPKSMPTSAFATTDGHVNIGCGDQIRWERVARALGLAELIERPEYRTGTDRSINREKLKAELGAVFKTKSMSHWVEVLNAQGVPCGPIYSVDQVFADPQVRHQGMAAPVHHPKLGDIELVGQPIHMSRTPWKMRAAAPDQGQHTDKILTEIGYSAGEIAALRAAKVV
jgi:crotonobetainyl-CoA:carnitine CoA-transferase CaiB-like acyl-CoA transferase